MDFSLLQSFTTIACCDDREPGSFEESLQDAAQVDVVIDQKYHAFGLLGDGHLLFVGEYRSPDPGA
jgi:hypothetical protein